MGHCVQCWDVMGHEYPEPRFMEGDIIVLRDNEYEVERIDTIPHGGVLQYRLKARSGPPATLKPHSSKDESEGYTIVEYHEVENDDIAVIA